MYTQGLDVHAPEPPAPLDEGLLEKRFLKRVDA